MPPRRERLPVEAAIPARDGGQADAARGGGLYFTSAKAHLKFISSGSTLLDCALGGGWVMGRIANIIGDKSTGKTLLVIEAFANCIRRHPRAKMYYREAESAFDRPYASALGMPVDKIKFIPDDEIFDTVEHFAADINKILETHTGAGLYALDSLDSLSDDAEMSREIGEGSYGTQKAKMMSQIFRKVVRRLEQTELGMVIISQIRDNIGATFGRKTTRSGGRALDFYATHIVYLAHVKTLTRTIANITRPVGVTIKAKVDKNKVGLPMREVEFNIMFGFGIDDPRSCLEWLATANRLAAVEPGLTKEKITAFINSNSRGGYDHYKIMAAEVAKQTKVVWREVEERFMPTMGKYQAP